MKGYFDMWVSLNQINNDKQETSLQTQTVDLAFSNIFLEAAVDIIQGNGNR